MSRFDYVKYDLESQQKQEILKAMFGTLSSAVETKILPSRAQSLILTKLEEAYMWCGKAIRDEQIIRNGSAELQEDRINS